LDDDFAEADAKADTGRERAEPLFACNLAALSAEQRRQHSRVTEQLKSEVLAGKELPDGYAFQFAPHTDTLRLLVDFVANERLCCPFFTFTIRVEPESGPIWLQLTGEEGIQAFIRAELDW
jgi:hypothetical protein